MGKYNPIKFDNMEEITNNNINPSEYDWNLKCYYHHSRYFFTFYLNNGENQIYDLQNVGNFNFLKYEYLQLHSEMYDFKLVDKHSYINADSYPMCALIKWGDSIGFIGTKLYLDDHDYIFRELALYKKLIEAKKIFSSKF